MSQTTAKINFGLEFEFLQVCNNEENTMGLINFIASFALEISYRQYK